MINKLKRISKGNHRYKIYLLTQPINIMKTLLTVLCFVLSIGWIQGQEDTKSMTAVSSSIEMDERFKVNTVEFVENDNKKSIQISITNNGEFFSYPVVQVRIGDKIIANEEGIFFLYGMVETEQFVLETNSTPTDGTELTILIGSASLEKPHVIKYKYSEKAE